MRNTGLLFILLLVVCVTAFAADTIVTWPTDGKEPIVKVTIGKMRQVNTTSGQTDYVADANVENVGKKPLPFASFYLYLLDKNKKRIGEGYFEVSNLAAGQQAKVAVTARAMGTIAGMELQPQNLPSDEPVKMKVNVATTPKGASLKIDGQDNGFTPQVVMLLAGKHTFEFSKEGYQTVSSPIEVTTSSLQAVNVDLVPAVLDTVVLRDGSIVLGDVASVTATAVTVKVSGKVKSYPRNQVARVIFAERKPVRAVRKGK